MAELLAIDFATYFSIEIDYLYTFESPRVGNEKYVLYYSQKISNSYRITHHYDPVPHVPTEA